MLPFEISKISTTEKKIRRLVDFRMLILPAVVSLTAANYAMGDTISVETYPNSHNNYSSIGDDNNSGNGNTSIGTLPMVGTDTSTNKDEATAYDLQSSNLNLQFTDTVPGTDFTTQNEGTIYFIPNEDTTYELSGSFSGEGTGLGADDFGVNLTEISYAAGGPYYIHLFSSSGINGSLDDPSNIDGTNTNGFPMESGSLTGPLLAGDVYFISYGTGDQSAASTGFVNLQIGLPLPEPVAGGTAFFAIAGIALRRRRSIVRC
jgi:hypothetical protein